MRSLFLRVFLWFWLVMAAVVAVLVVTSPFFTRSRPALDRWHRGAEGMARARVDTAAEHIAERGLDGLRAGRGPRRGERGGLRPPGRLFVLDDEGREVRGGDAPPEVREVARRALAVDEERSERVGALHLVARPVVDPDGRRAVVVAAHHSPPRLIHLLEPGALAWRLAALIVVVGALSFWLARYLSSPVDALRRATRRLSGGDLQARVGGRVGRRRDEIGDLARDFDAMAERIEALIGAQRRLLRDVSHELRSPLARLTVALELARARSGDEAAGALDRIELEAGRLDELIGELLLLERLASGSDDEPTVEVDLTELVAAAADDAGFEVGDDGPEVRVDRPDHPVIVRGRPGLVRRAVENVLRNAVRHAPPSSMVEVAVATVGDGARITVRDRGPGVGDGEIERIFEPFYRVSEARDRPSGGTGLGLAIAAAAVRAHGGTITAANRPGGGLEVVIGLPSADPAPEP